jgi:hypothetical protein
MRAGYPDVTDAFDSDKGIALHSRGSMIPEKWTPVFRKDHAQTKTTESVRRKRDANNQP